MSQIAARQCRRSSGHQGRHERRCAGRNGRIEGLSRAGRFLAAHGIAAGGLIERRPHPSDGRAMGLHLTAAGKKMVKQAEVTASELEEATTARLTAAERKMLMQLLRKIYI